MSDPIEDPNINLANTRLDRLAGAEGVGAKVREHFKPASNAKEERYRAFLAQHAQQEEAAAKTEQAKPDLAEIKKVLASQDPEAIEALAEFVQEIQYGDAGAEYDADTELQEDED